MFNEIRKKSIQMKFIKGVIYSDNEKHFVSIFKFPIIIIRTEFRNPCLFKDNIKFFFEIIEKRAISIKLDINEDIKNILFKSFQFY